MSSRRALFIPCLIFSNYLESLFSFIASVTLIFTKGPGPFVLTQNMKHEEAVLRNLQSHFRREAAGCWSTAVSGSPWMEDYKSWHKWGNAQKNQKDQVQMEEIPLALFLISSLKKGKLKLMEEISPYLSFETLTYCSYKTANCSLSYSLILCLFFFLSFSVSSLPPFIFGLFFFNVQS